MENLPTPLSRVELYLAKACGMAVTVPEQPLSRLEQFLAILAGDTSITMPTPMSLTEQWLAYVLGVTPDPLLAVEGACLIGAQKVDVRYFAVAASMPGATLPEAPQNRAEMYWAHIAGNPPTPGILKYVTGKYFYLTDVVSGIEELQYVKGDTYQQTYSGKNLVDLVPATNTMPDKTQSATFDTVYEATLGRNVLHASGTASYPYIGFTLPNRLTSGKYYAFMIKYRTLTTTTGEVSSDAKNFRMYPGRNNLYSNNTPTGIERTKDESGANNIRLYDTQTYLTRCIRFYADPDVYDETSTPAWYTGFSISWVPAGVSGNISAKEIWIADIQIYEISQTDWDSNNYTGTDFEKYTGGIPAPSPDYPQPIQVVTGEQTVTVRGKNLLDSLHGFADKYINDSGVEASGGGNNALFGYIAVKPETAYTLSQKSDSLRLRNYGFAYYDTNKTFLSRAAYNLQTTQTITTPSNCSFIRIWVANSQTGVSQAIIEQSQLQFEQGSATAYQPYQSQAYPISLGATELCKIGTYQDKIFNNDPNEDWYNPDLEDNAWYVHKATDKYTFDGTENWETLQYGTNSWRIRNLIYFSFDTDKIQILSNIFIGIKHADRNTAGSNVIYSAANNEFDIRNTAFTTQANVRTATNGNYIYCALATATDTKITDATLISQLEALNSALLPKPIANITVSATGTNLTPYLTIAYYGSDEE